MAKCVHHPGRAEAVKHNGVSYCEQCKKDIEAAAAKVDKHVDPKGCFVWYTGSKDGWQPMPGTGCAHYCAHGKAIKKGSATCLLGHTVRVKDLVKGLSKVSDVANVKKGQIWADDKLSHCGVVDSIKAVKGKDPEIKIKHSSSRQGKVATNDWAKYFKSGGSFYK